ncbi:MAG: DoxX family protein [Prolixibacteraceae bacterium]|jgi:uncharacterized membrane protein YphA (DoxX/SURF4 family)|nr:DoxX family protein [Prolixibacteraceae bacterium]
MKLLREIARILIGLTFVFSGFVKGVDPLGSTYKFTDYFSVFGTNWANDLAFGLAILMSLVEFGIGIALLFNYRMKIFSWLVLLFMAFFLPFTLWIAIANPVTDCGCFGDAWVISNWETFYKNIFLSFLAVFIFINRAKYSNAIKPKFQNGYFAFFLLALGFIQYYSINHLPLLDFRPYKVGVNISEGMERPVDAPSDVYKTEFIYKNKNTQKTKEFDDSNYPWKDTLNWEYVDSKSILVEEGYHPPIHNFTIENNFGEDISEFYLYDPGYTFILVTNNLSKSSKKTQNELNTLAQRIQDEGMNFICLTSSTDNDINNFINEYYPPYQFFFCDEITLKTIIRSNPGLVLTKEGTILKKWHWKDIPAYEKINF